MLEDEKEGLEAALRAVDPTNFDCFINQVAKDPLGVAKDCQRSMQILETTFEKPLNQLLAVGYAIANHLRDRPLDLEAFVKQDCWRENFQKLPEGDAILRLVFRFLKQAWRRGSPYDTACRYTVALANSFENHIPPPAIPTLIKHNGGIEALYRAEVQIRKRELLTGERQTPHRNSAVPRTVEAKKSLMAMSDGLLHMTKQEERLLSLMEEFQSDLIDFIRSRHKGR